MEDQKRIEYDFFGTPLPAFEDEKGQVFVPLHHLCDIMGLYLSAQRQRILRDQVMSEYLVMFRTSLRGPNGSYRDREVMCLNARCIPYWICTLDVSRIREDRKSAILDYQHALADQARMVFIPSTNDE